MPKYLQSDWWSAFQISPNIVQKVDIKFPCQFGRKLQGVR